MFSGLPKVAHGRPAQAGAAPLRASLSGIDHRPHAGNTLTPRAVRPYNYSPLGPSTLHVGAPLKSPRVK